MSHFINFIEEKWINILTFDFVYVSKSVEVREKNFNKFFVNKMAGRIYRKQIRFFDSLLGRITTDRNFAPRIENEKDSGNIFRNFEFSKNGFNFNKKTVC